MHSAPRSRGHKLHSWAESLVRDRPLVSTRVRRPGVYVLEDYSPPPGNARSKDTSSGCLELLTATRTDCCWSARSHTGRFRLSDIVENRLMALSAGNCRTTCGTIRSNPKVIFVIAHARCGPFATFA